MVCCWIFLSTHHAQSSDVELPGRTAPGSCSMSPTTGHGAAAPERGTGRRGADDVERQ